MYNNTDYRCLVRKSPSLHGRKSTPTPKFSGMAEAYFVYHIGNFQISLIYAFIGCPQSVYSNMYKYQLMTVFCDTHCPIMKLIFDYKFRFYTSRMNEICLHCHRLFFSSIILCLVLKYCLNCFYNLLVDIRRLENTISHSSVTSNHYETFQRQRKLYIMRHRK